MATKKEEKKPTKVEKKPAKVVETNTATTIFNKGGVPLKRFR